MNLEQYHAMLRELGCIICVSPPSLHHPRFASGMSQKANDWIVIPLCPHHHQHGGYGEAIHMGQQSFEKRYGTEGELLGQTIKKVVNYLEEK